MDGEVFMAVHLEKHAGASWGEENVDSSSSVVRITVNR